MKKKLTDLITSDDLKNRVVSVCIACRELESWYLAQLEAVEKGLGINGLMKRQEEKKFRQPDGLGSPKNELMRLTGDV